MAGKKAKIKNIKPKIQTQMTNQVTGNWLYFCPMEQNIRGIYEVLKEQNEVEIWEEAGVMEVLLDGKSSFDIETTQIHPKDEVTLQFAEEQGAKSVFLVTFSPEEYESAKERMKQILDRLGGIFCGDTEDFMPQVR